MLIKTDTRLVCKLVSSISVYTVSTSQVSHGGIHDSPRLHARLFHCTLIGRGKKNNRINKQKVLWRKCQFWIKVVPAFFKVLSTYLAMCSALKCPLSL